MAYLKVLTPPSTPLSELLGPLPTEEDTQMPILEDPTEALTRAVLRGRVEEEMKAASQNNMVMPPSLLDQVADQVLFLAKDEPCGLRGSVLTVLWADVEEEVQQLAQVKADTHTPTTHHLVLVLRPDPASWYTKMTRIFRSLGKRRMVVSPQFDLFKRSLYNFEE